MKTIDSIKMLKIEEIILNFCIDNYNLILYPHTKDVSILEKKRTEISDLVSLILGKKVIFYISYSREEFFYTLCFKVLLMTEDLKIIFRKSVFKNNDKVSLVNENI